MIRTQGYGTRLHNTRLRRRRGRGLMALVLMACVLLVANHSTLAQPQAKPTGEMRWALYVTLAPSWFDPGEVVGLITPFWVLYAIHDALVKPMPGNLMAPSLAEAWTVSADQLVYEFTLRQGLKFHNGDPFTAEDVKFSFLRYKGSKQLRDQVREVEIVDPYRLRFHLHTPWPDFMTYYGTLATGAAWIVEGYWRKVPHVKRLVFKSVPESATRMAMLKRGEVDVAYLLDAPLAEEVKRDPKLKLAFSGGIGIFFLDYFDQWDPKSPWHDKRVRLAANYAIDRAALSEAETLGASPPTGDIVPRTFEFALPIEPYPYDPAKAKQLLAEAGYPNGFEAGELHQIPPYFSMGEAIINYLGAVEIKLKLRPMERAAFFSAWQTKQLRGLCVCASALYGNAASRLSEIVPSDGAYAYGGYPDIDALYKQQAVELDHSKRATLLYKIQQLLHERVRFGPLYQYIWPSGIGPRVEEAALMLIDPYPWSAPLEEVRLKPE